MKVNRVREALRAGRCVVGTMISDMRNPEVAYILAAAGMDFLMMDLEHSSPDLESVQNIVRAARSAGVAPLARVTDNEYALIARVLDTGMMGVMVPRVETAEQARHAVSCAKYPPLGSRGFGGRGPLTDYEDVPLAQTLHWINENTLVIVQVESGIAIDNLEEIARVPGVDVALIGPNDLSISLGIPGEYRHPVFLEAVDRVFGICLRNGVSPAMHTGDLQAVKAMREKGARFLIYSNETRMLLGAAKAAVRELGGERLASHSSLRQKTGTGETVSDSQAAISEIQAGAVDSSACTRFLPQADSAGQS